MKGADLADYVRRRIPRDAHHEWQLANTSDGRTRPVRPTFDTAILQVAVYDKVERVEGRRVVAVDDAEESLEVVSDRLCSLATAMVRKAVVEVMGRTARRRFAYSARRGCLVQNGHARGSFHVGVGEAPPGALRDLVELVLDAVPPLPLVPPRRYPAPTGPLAAFIKSLGALQAKETTSS